MKKLDGKKVIECKNSNHCVVSEFPIDDRDINFSIAKISSRYPDSGCVANTIVKEIVYVHEGSGIIVVEGIEHTLKAGDVILISQNEKFYWDGDMTLHISCTPSFTPEQHIHIPKAS
ncbi:MAG: AraC family ligand binding domain-containing protein [Gammaproteobacteria bacterium]|nr:AraC family ligand binding domain-containing protein [Gammaproteobacteria bacterium]